MSRPRVAVWKFASCDGCQLTLLDCEERLFDVIERVEIVHFLEAGAVGDDGTCHYDLSLVEGSVTTEADIARIRDIRARSTWLVTIGACASAGGIQALRNFARVEEWCRVVYAAPQYISTLATSTPIADHVQVDFELRGCPIDKQQLLAVIAAFANGHAPALSSASVCAECKMHGHLCVMVARGVPCLGPMTHAGCGALCPGYDRGCYGCFGPSESANTPATAATLRRCGMSEDEIVLLTRTFSAWSPETRDYGQADTHPASGRT